MAALGPQLDRTPEARSIATSAAGSPICIIPNGVDLPEINWLDADLRGKSILFLGRIHPKKGIAELLGGWSKSELANAGWSLDIAGWDDGGHVAGLEAQVATLGLGESVRFVGPVFGAAKELLFRRAGAFVLPSFSEGLPMTVLEAWSFGVPVIMSDACNLAEGFDAGAAIRCAPEPESIASALNLLATDTDTNTRMEMGALGRALVERSFSWPTISRRMVEIYEWLGRGGEACEAPETVFDR